MNKCLTLIKKQMEGFIYKITNQQNGKIYIGQTSRTIEERWTQHTRNAYKNNNLEYKNKFHRAIRKYGSGGFLIEEQEKITASDENELRQKLNDAETKWILYYNSKNSGYNSSLGGDYNPMYGVKGKENPCSVKINQYDLNGHFIKTYDSLSDIIREFGNQGNVLKVCKSNRLETRKVTAFGYVWRYYSEFPNENNIIISQEELDIRDAKKKYQFSKDTPDSTSKVIEKISKKIDQLDIDGNFIKTFDSIHAAARETNISFSTIQSALKRSNNIAKGYRWKFHED